MDLQTLIIGFAVLILKLGVVLAVLLTAAAYLVLFERKFLGRLQIRYGPNRAGPFGLLQPFADTIKMITKEDIGAGRSRPGDLPLRPGRGRHHRAAHVFGGPLRPRPHPVRPRGQDAWSWT